MRRRHLFVSLFVVFAAVAAVSVLFYFFRSPEEPEDAIRVIYESEFSGHKDLVRRFLHSAEGSEAPDLSFVSGGVVPHHIPTAIPVLAEFYAKLKKSRGVNTFIILGPDHIDRGAGDVSISRAVFMTPFGALYPDLRIADELEKTGFVMHGEAPFEREHSIHAQTLLIASVFPEAKIVPLVFRSSMSNESAQEFGKVLARHLNSDTFLVASVDFSHYLSESQARPLDELSASVLRRFDVDAPELVEADSTQAIAALISALNEQGARDTADIRVFNTSDFSENSDFTTGYISGFFGVRNQEDSAKLPREEPVSLIFAGDIMLSRFIGTLSARKNDWTFPFRRIADTTRPADIAVGNLEGPISARGERAGSEHSFRADPRAIQGLTFAGFDVVSIANNHIWDYGAEAFLDTLEILRKNGIQPVGGGEDYSKAHAPVIKEIRGIRFAFLSYTNLISRSLAVESQTPAISFAEKEEIVRDIKEARKKSDVVVALFHWGDEYETRPNALQEDLAHAAIDAGAKLVIGHHPHTIQDTEEYNGGFIAYSLGNLVFDQNFSEETKRGLVLRVAVRGGTIESVEKLFVSFTDEFEPVLDGMATRSDF